MGFWRNRNVFVTGGGGLLGSWLTQELVARGAAVTCLLRDSVPASRLMRERIIDRVNVVRGGLEDYDTLLRALNEYEINTVFHLGAQTIVGTASRSALSTFESNIKGTWNLLEAARNCPKLIERVVVASSDKAYGSQENLPYTEDTPLAGRFPYDVSKACADMIALSYFHTYRVPVAVTRCGNLFGGGDLNFNRIIPGTIRAAIHGEPPVIRSDGTFVRDYFYVRDAAAAYLELAERMPDAGFVGEAFNFGNERPIAVLELVREILDTMGRGDLKPVVLSQAAHEIPRQYLDCAKARRLMNWTPKFTLREGLVETVAWYEQFEGAASAAVPA